MRTIQIKCLPKMKLPESGKCVIQNNKLGQRYLTHSAGIKKCALIIMALYKSLWNTVPECFR